MYYNYIQLTTEALKLRLNSLKAAEKLTIVSDKGMFQKLLSQYTLPATSNWSLFKLIFFCSIANKIEMNLCLNMCILMGKSLVVFRDSCFHSSVFSLKMQNIDCFLRKMILSAFLIDLKCRWLQSGLADLEKQQTLAFLLMVDFLRIFEITHFLRFLKDF